MSERVCVCERERETETERRRREGKDTWTEKVKCT